MSVIIRVVSAAFQSFRASSEVRNTTRWTIWRWSQILAGVDDIGVISSEIRLSTIA